MIPDIEAITGRWLRQHPSMLAVPDVRIVGQPPSSTTGPWVQIRQLDAQSPTSSRADHLIGYLIQLDCYASRDGGQAQATRLARAVRYALNELPGVRDDAVVCAARTVGMLRAPDTDLEPARERVVLTAEIHAHPQPA